jgi:hypothetical protein
VNEGQLARDGTPPSGFAPPLFLNRVRAVPASTEGVLVLRPALAVLALTAVATVVGCGGDGGGGQPPPPKPVSKQELRRMIDQALREFSQAFGPVEQATKKRDLEGMKKGFLRVADIEHRQIEKLEGIRPPKEAQQPLTQLLTGARAQVAEFRRMAGKKDLTLKEVGREQRQPSPADKQVERALQTLAERGFVSREPPG